jgi:6-phosphogluconolactonase
VQRGFGFIGIAVGALALSACGGGGNGDGNNPPPPVNSTVGGTLTGLAANTTVVLQNNSGNNLSLTANGAFTFSTALSTGTAYSVSVLTQPSGQLCTVSSGNGTMASANITNVAVLCTPPVGKFLYVPNRRTNNVSAYSINASTGALTAVAAAAVPADWQPTGATADPAGKFLYVADQGADTTSPRLSVYSINATSGTLTQVPSSPFELSNPPPAPNGGNVPLYKPFVHPSGKFVYVASDFGKLYGFAADGNGGLTDIQAPTIINPAGFVAAEFDAAAKFLYVPHNNFNNENRGGVSIYDVSATTGTVQPLGEVSTGGVGPSFGKLVASGKFLVVPQSSGGGSSSPRVSSIAIFAVDSQSGMLTPVAGSPFSTTLDTRYLISHPTKNFVYALFGQSIAMYQIDASTGVLTPIAGSPLSIANVGTAGALRIDPSGRFLYLSNTIVGAIQGFAIDQTSGALTQIPGLPIQVWQSPVLTLDPSGRFLYMLQAGQGLNQNSIHSYAVDPVTGALTFVNWLSTAENPQAIEVVGRQ